MLKGLFGNATAEKVLLHIFHYHEIHALGIARDYGMAKSPVLNQLNRLKAANILVSRAVGKARLYSFNEKSPYIKPLKQILRIAYDSIPLKDKQILFSAHRSPRAVAGVREFKEKYGV
jgi:hypothetical protein